MAIALMERRGPSGIDRLTGRQKVAVLLVALGPDAARSLMGQLTQDELEEISLEIAQLDHIPQDIVRAVLNEWERTGEAAASLAAGGIDYARQILESSLGPQKAGVALRRIEAQIHEGGGFQTLRNADPQQLASVIRNEHPQGLALILAHLDPTLVAEVLNQLDPATGGDVLLRMAKMEKVLPEVLQLVERSLGGDAAMALSQDLSAAGGPQSVAAVLNLVPGTLEKELLDSLARQNQALAEEIKGLMFVFEDMVRLDDKAMQRVLRDVDSKELAMALKAASEDVKQRIRSTMTQRALDALDEEIEFLGPVRVRDVQAAQGNIVRTVRALEETGEIVIGGADDEIIE